MALYKAKTDLINLMCAGIKTQFEAANVQPWIERVYKCQSLRAIARLQAEFERV